MGNNYWSFSDGTYYAFAHLIITICCPMPNSNKYWNFKYSTKKIKKKGYIQTVAPGGAGGAGLGGLGLKLLLLLSSPRYMSRKWSADPSWDFGGDSGCKSGTLLSGVICGGDIGRLPSTELAIHVGTVGTIRKNQSNDTVHLGIMTMYVNIKVYLSILNLKFCDFSTNFVIR